jgi:hypothetical protein
MNRKKTRDKTFFDTTIVSGSLLTNFQGTYQTGFHSLLICCVALGQPPWPPGINTLVSAPVSTPCDKHGGLVEHLPRYTANTQCETRRRLPVGIGPPFHKTMPVARCSCKLATHVHSNRNLSKQTLLSKHPKYSIKASWHSSEHSEMLLFFRL